MAFLKKITLLALFMAIFYLLLGYHYIILDNSVRMLKKSSFSLKYTIFSTNGKTPESILSIPELLDDGIGDLLLKEGKISEEEFEVYREKMEDG